MKQMLRVLLVMSCVVGTSLITETVLSAFSQNVALAGPHDP
jgi:hypothetical protein